MNGITAHPKDKQEARLITELFDKMNIAYERGERGINEPCRKSHIPNATTRKAIKEAREGKGKRFDSLTEFFDELNS